MVRARTGLISTATLSGPAETTGTETADLDVDEVVDAFGDIAVSDLQADTNAVSNDFFY